MSGGPKGLNEVRESLRQRLKHRRPPMQLCDPAVATKVIDELEGIDGALWARAWGKAGDQFAQAARQAEERGDREAASEAHLQAYAFYYAGRYPCPNHPAKVVCATKARAHYLAASQSFDPPLERIVIPFTGGRPDEGKEIICYLRKPKGVERPPVVVSWGGIDGYKEERHANAIGYLEAGLASLVIDMPGTGESPVYASADAERQFTPVFDYLRQRLDVDGRRVGVCGSSFGGYWATKLAHTHRDYLRAAVNWGGGVHLAFQPEWTRGSRFADSYLMDLAETRAFMCNITDFDEYVRFIPRLSLVEQGILDLPCAPLLAVNGKEDKQVPIADLHLLLEYGQPKRGRVFPGGHMGRTPQTVPTIISFLAEQLNAP